MSILEDAWDWTKGAANTIAGGVDDAFSGETVNAYQPQPHNFQYGGSIDVQRQELNRLNQMSYGQHDLQRANAMMGQSQALQNAGAYESRRLEHQGQALASTQAHQAQYNPQDTNYQRQSAQQLGNYARQGPGPSAAEAQLRMGQEQTMAQALSMARSGRGGGANAAMQRQAMFANAASQQQLNGQLANLRAQESDAWRGRQLQAMGAESQAAAQLRGQGDAATQYNTGLRQQQQMQNQNIQQNYAQMGQQAYNTGLQGGLNYAQLSENAMNRRAQQQQTYEQMRQNIYGNQLQAGMGYEQLNSANSMQAQMSNQATDTQRDGSLTGLAAGAAGVLMMSDVRSKENIDGGAAQAYLQMLSGQGGAGGALASSYLAGRKIRDSREQAEDEDQPDATEVEAPAPAIPQQPQTSGGGGGLLGGILGSLSDKRAKRAESRADGLAQALIAQRNPSTDFRQARGYEYEYKPEVQQQNPGMAPAGKQFGPMAQDLENIPGVVKQDPATGLKAVDASRLTLANTAALSEQQRKLDALMAARGGNEVLSDEKGKMQMRSAPARSGATNIFKEVQAESSGQTATASGGGAGGNPGNLSVRQSQQFDRSRPIDAGTAEKGIDILDRTAEQRPPAYHALSPEELNPNNPAPGEPGYYGGYDGPFGNSWAGAPTQYEPGAFAGPDASMFADTGVRFGPMNAPKPMDPTAVLGMDQRINRNRVAVATRDPIARIMGRTPQAPSLQFGQNPIAGRANPNLVYRGR